MNILNIPGFTAEASFFKTDRHYSMTPTTASHTSSGKIVPQWWRPVHDFDDCILKCCEFDFHRGYWCHVVNVCAE